MRTRAALLDALTALRDQLDAVVVIGAQAVYLRTGHIEVAIEETTKDSDVALDPGRLSAEPRIEESMAAAGFVPSATGQPGSWVNADGIPVDLMVPDTGTGRGQMRGGRIPPHHRRATRRARGLDACLVDNDPLEVSAFDPADSRRTVVRVAGPAALLVAKMHKISERIGTGRLNDKDAHDSYRILRAYPTDQLAERFDVLLRESMAAATTREALVVLGTHFAPGPDALGAMMAGRAEAGIGAPDEVAVSVALLASDLVERFR